MALRSGGLFDGPRLPLPSRPPPEAAWEPKAAAQSPSVPPRALPRLTSVCGLRWLWVLLFLFLVMKEVYAGL